MNENDKQYIINLRNALIKAKSLLNVPHSNYKHHALNEIDVALHYANKLFDEGDKLNEV